MQYLLSVIICTHNPRSDYLDRVLEALKRQTFPKEHWQLILVDNTSDSPVADRWDLNWHPHGKHLSEKNAGLVHARIAGIRSAEADVIIFVDDDNVLAPDYLDTALRLCNEMPFIGAFGGNLKGEFEVEPDSMLKPYLSYIAVREVIRSEWSNRYEWSTTPAGAGMVIRTSIARKYANEAYSNPYRNKLGRKGKSLISCDDIDMAYTAIDMGYGCGLFSDLQLTHLIPRQRVEPGYIIRLVEANVYSDYVLGLIRPAAMRMDTKVLLGRFPLLTKLLKWMLSSSFEYKVYCAKEKALKKILRNAQKGSIEDLDF